ncbi:MAG: hypothetical protein AB1599_01620, partial [Planctomycetota bacterium]
MKKTLLIPAAATVIILFVLGLTIWAGNPASDLQTEINKGEKRSSSKTIAWRMPRKSRRWPPNFTISAGA